MTIAGDLPPGTRSSILKQAGLRGGTSRPMRYAIAMERFLRNSAACGPDLPGCAATGASDAGDGP